MKKKLCFFVATMLFTIVTSAQDITTDSVAILDSIKHAGTRVQIRYVPTPKDKPKPNEFFSVQLGAFIAERPSSKFAIAENVYRIVNEEEIYVYLSGEFNELNDAVLEKRKLKNKGQKNIYVVKVIDKRKIVIVE